MGYAVFKLVHLIGIVLLLGNVTVTATWKMFADRTGSASVAAFAQRLVTVTDWWFTAWGIVLTVVGGFGAAGLAGLDPWRTGWIVKSLVMFAVSGAIWAGILLPIQIRQAREARRFAPDAPIPRAYRRRTWLWLGWGVVATVPLVAAMWFMVTKG